MTAVSATRDAFLGELRALVWEQWSQMGVSAPPPERREGRAADPEALLVLALHVGRHDPRLFDEILDWLARNLGVVSTQRLRNLGKGDAAARWSPPRSTGPRAGPPAPSSSRPTTRRSSRSSRVFPRRAPSSTRPSRATASRAIRRPRRASRWPRT